MISLNTFAQITREQSESANVAPSKLAAVKYKKELDNIGHVSSEILLITRQEGHDSVEESKPADEVVGFWNEMMTRWETRKSIMKG